MRARAEFGAATAPWAARPLAGPLGAGTPAVAAEDGAAPLGQGGRHRGMPAIVAHGAGAAPWAPLAVGLPAGGAPAPAVGSVILHRDPPGPGRGPWDPRRCRWWRPRGAPLPRRGGAEAPRSRARDS